MTKVRKGLLTIIFAMLVFVTAIIGLFCVFEKDADNITAKAEAGTFSMVEGTSLYIGEDEEKASSMRFLIYLSEEDVTKLNSTEKGSLDGTQRHMYYLQMLRVRTDNKTVEYEEEFNVNASSASQYTPYDIKQLTINEDGTCMLYLPLPADYNTEYVYYAELVKEKQNNAGFWLQKIKYSFETQKETNRITRSVKTVALRALEDNENNAGTNLKDYQIGILNHMAGVTVSTEEFPVVLEYQELVVGQWAQYVTKTETYKVNKLYALSKDMVSSVIIDLSDRKSEYDFNCKYETEYTSQITYIANPREEWTYRFDETEQKGYLTVTYKDYQYKDFAILLKDNDLSDQVDSTVFVYTTNVKEDTVNGKTYTTLTFSYETIEAQAYEGYKWLFDIKDENVTALNETETVITSFTEEGIWIAFLPEDVDDLRNVLITINAEIIEDYECVVQVKYAKLVYENDTIKANEETSVYTMMYSAYTEIAQWITFQKSEYYTAVAEALLLDELNGQTFYVPSGATFRDGTESDPFIVTVTYSYNTLFRIVSTDKGVYFVACNSTSKTYTYAGLNLAPNDDGLRLQNLTSENSSLAEVTFSEDNPQTTTVELHAGSHENRILTLTAEYSDSWNLNVAYFETYVNKAGKVTPFAVKKQEKYTVKNAVIESLSLEDVKELLGKNDMTVANTVAPGEEISLSFDGASTYTATLVYGTGSLVQVDQNGKRAEIQIPLTGYVDWVSKMGNPEWTVMMLNTQKNTWFYHTNDMKREDLYGLFSVAIFQEKVTDLNYYFQSNTGDGQMTIFDSISVSGSKFYKACGDLYLNGNVFTSLLGYTGMFFAEAFNNDNTMYHSYFFYMDGTNPTDGYISNGGADDAYDDDSAIENAGEDFKDAIAGAWGDSSIKRILAIVLAVAGAVAFVAGAYWLLSKVGMFDSSKKKARRRKRK